MNRYSAYKYSDVDWIGEVPKTWRVIPFKRLTQVKRGASPRPIDDPKYFDDNGEFGWVRIADVTASERYLENTTQKLSELGASLSLKRYPGDLFLSIAGTVGKPIISKIKCCIHDGFVWFPDLKINPEFLYYIFSAGLAYQGLGKLGTQLNLNTDTVGYINLPVPSNEEICQIVKYLDKTTEKIDSLISKKQKLIELLKEERAAIISQAVTKGIDQNVVMKDSGIEWLGNIPLEWEVKRLKYLSHSRVSNVDKKSEDEISVKLCNYIDVYKNEIIDEKINFMSATATNAQIDAYELKRGDVLLTKDSETPDDIGIPAYVNLQNTNKVVCGYHLAISTPTDQVLLGRYLFRLFQSNIFRSYFEICSNGITRYGLDKYSILNAEIPLPSFTEQKLITDFLDKATSSIDSTILNASKEIALLQEYRTALISEVVTGKIDVRQEVVS